MILNWCHSKAATTDAQKSGGFFNDIKMEFGLNKCRTINIVRGKLQEGGFEMQNGQNIAAMEALETYKQE